MKKSLLLLLFLFVFRVGFAQGTWTMKTSLPAAGRMAAVAFSIGTKGYLGTGNTPGWIFLDDFWEYDPVNDTWAQKANFAGGKRAYGVAFSIGNKGYVGTGQDMASTFYNDLWEYSQSANSWTKKASMPGAGRHTAAAFAVNGFGYIGTGGGLADFWKYNPVLDTWTQMKNFPGGGQADIDRGDFVIGNKAYWLCHSSGFWEYDPATDTWAQKANFTGSARYGAVGFSVCDMGYIGLGCCYNTDFLKYNPTTNLWSTASSFPATGRADGQSFVINNKAYVGTGLTSASNYLNDWGEFAPTACSALPVSNFTCSDSTFCNESGSCIDFFDHSTNNPTSWKWFFPGATPDTSTQQNPTSICYYVPGTYAVTLIVNNSVGSDTLTVSPKITFNNSAAKPNLTRSNDTIFCSHAASYQWYFNGSLIPGAVDSFYVIQGDGLYAVQITDDNGCTRLSDGFTVSVNEVNGFGGIKIFPNPVQQSLVIGFDNLNHRPDAEPVEARIFNVLGETVLQSEITNQKPPKASLAEGGSEIDVSRLAKGIYMVEVSNSGKVFRGKFVKE